MPDFQLNQINFYLRNFNDNYTLQYSDYHFRSNTEKTISLAHLESRQSQEDDRRTGRRWRGSEKLGAGIVATS